MEKYLFHHLRYYLVVRTLYYHIILYEAFPLLPYLMRPYPQKLLNNKRMVYNFRHSRGRKSVKCSFGMLNSKFRIFEHSICCDEDRVINIVKAACVLHNFVRILEGKLYSIVCIVKRRTLFERTLRNFKRCRCQTNPTKRNQSYANQGHIGGIFFLSKRQYTLPIEICSGNE